MSATNAARLLDLWERVVTAPDTAWGAALLEAVGDVPEGIGARNAALVALRAQLFGARWDLRARCPVCGESCEFSVDACALAEQLAKNRPDPARTHELALPEGRFSFRLPSTDDLCACARCGDIDSAELALLERCLIGTSVAALPKKARAQISTRIRELDPAALVSFDVRCPSASCAHAWDAALDVAASLHAELKVVAERILLEVDVLARAYGWNENEVLALTPVRRAAYLQLNGAS